MLIIFAMFAILVGTQSNWIQSIDTFGEVSLKYRENTSLQIFFSFMTRFGDYLNVVIASIIVCLILILNKKKSLVIWFSLTMGFCAALIPYSLKLGIARARPVSLDVQRAGYSFPSGHVTGSSVFYGLLLVLIFMYCKNRVVNIIATCVYILLIGLIAASRVYLGVHFLSDVIASIFLGGGMVLISTWIYLKSQNEDSTNQK